MVGRRTRVFLAGRMGLLRDQDVGALGPGIVGSRDAGREVVRRQPAQPCRARDAQALRNLSVVPGDRVVAFMPNIPETVVAFLATASIDALKRARSSNDRRSHRRQARLARAARDDEQL